MNYKTVTLELLQDQPQLYDRLKRDRLLLAALEACSTDLRTRHLALARQLSQSRPEASLEQTSLEAYEIAVHELHQRIEAAALPDESIRADQLIDFIRLHTPTGS